MSKKASLLCSTGNCKVCCCYLAAVVKKLNACLESQVLFRNTKCCGVLVCCLFWGFFDFLFGGFMSAWNQKSIALLKSLLSCFLTTNAVYAGWMQHVHAKCMIKPRSSSNSFSSGSVKSNKATLMTINPLTVFH